MRTAADQSYRMERLARLLMTHATTADAIMRKYFTAFRNVARVQKRKHQQIRIVERLARSGRDGFVSSVLTAWQQVVAQAKRTAQKGRAKVALSRIIYTVGGDDVIVRTCFSAMRDAWMSLPSVLQTCDLYCVVRSDFHL